MAGTARDHTLAFLAAFDGVDQIYDFRAMHDRDRSMPARTWRGTFAQHEAEMRALNESGPWGIHVVINRMGDLVDPLTHRLVLTKANVVACRAQVIDLDDMDGPQQLKALCASSTPPHIIVHTSGAKTQSVIKTQLYTDRSLYEANQRRLIGAYNGDRQFFTAEHTMRLPGFYHHKSEPQLVTVEAGPLWYKPPIDAWSIAKVYEHIPVVDSSDSKYPLGHPSLQAPDRAMLELALENIDPNELDRDNWIAVTAATKQAGWSLGEETVRSIWDNWCTGYTFEKGNDVRENTKQWQSIGPTAAGWPLLQKRSNLQAVMFEAQRVVVGDTGPSVPPASAVAPATDGIGPGVAPAGYVMWPHELVRYFDGFFWIATVGKILTHDGILMDQTKFNGSYNTVTYVVDLVGTESKNAWKAALENKAWSIPKVHHMRFLPQLPYGERVKDEFGREGVNTYQKPILEQGSGDVTPFLTHCEKLIADERDRTILYSFLAQCVQRPGVKIGWAVLIQSMEGAGKTIFKTILEAALGVTYVHSPNSQELATGGGKFNGWLRNRLMIICDEIRTDDKRVMVEVLKPMITEKRIEIQSKGVDQEMCDNPSNVMCFSNWKDAIPINKQSRRIAPIYSAVQTMEDLNRLGMTGQYFPNLYKWVDKQGGAAAVAAWLREYQIPEEFDALVNCSRAPETSSTEEAIIESRGWLEQMIADAIERQDQGFSGGWISSVCITKMVRESDGRAPGKKAMAAAVAALGYHKIGYADRIYPTENAPNKATLYNVNPNADVSLYGPAQRYGSANLSVVPMIKS